MTELTAETIASEDANLRQLRKSKLRTATVYTLQRFGLLLLFVLVVIGFSWLLPDSFATVLNFRNIAGNQSVLAIVTLAAIIPLICGHFDLSVGANLGATSIATASMLSHGAPLWLAILGGVALGLSIGLLNGFLV